MPEEMSSAQAATGSVSVPTTFDGAATAVAERPAFIESVPEEYREKQWIQDLAKNEDPHSALFKQLEHAQTLIGKKSTGIDIPGENATPEELKAFHKALGVPDTVDGYKYETPDISKEPEEVQNLLKESAKDDSLLKGMAAEALKLGISEKQFKGLAAAFDMRQIEQMRGLVEQAAKAGEVKSQKQMETFKGIYGDKSDAVQRIAKEMAIKVLPQNIRELNDPEIALHEALRIIHEKVYKNDSVSTPDASAPEMSKAGLQKKIFEIRANPAYADKFHPSHKALNEQADALYKRMLTKDEE